MSRLSILDKMRVLSRGDSGWSHSEMRELDWSHVLLGVEPVLKLSLVAQRKLFVHLRQTGPVSCRHRQDDPIIKRFQRIGRLSGRSFIQHGGRPQVALLKSSCTTGLET